MFCIVGEVTGENIGWIYKVVRVGGERYLGRGSACYRKDSCTVKEGGAHPECVLEKARSGIEMVVVVQTGEKWPSSNP